MEYVKCKSCGKPIASTDSNTITKNLHIQCKSCKVYNVVTENKVEKTYIKIGNRIVVK